MPDTVKLFEGTGLPYPASNIDYLSAYHQDKYLVYDTETSLIKKDSNVYVDIPKYVLGVVCNLGVYRPFTDEISIYVEVDGATFRGCILVGHNLPFDMNAIGYIPDYETMIWDTALFHYIYTSQRDTFPSLEHTAKFWLGTTENKESEVSEMIKAGIDPSDIPQEKLFEYCKKDVEITRDVFIKQFEAFVKANPVWQNMVINQMHWLKNIYCMSKTGLQLDIPRIVASRIDIDVEIERLRDYCCDYMRAMFYKSIPTVGKHELAFDINPMSNKQIEFILYGGSFPVYRYEEAGVFKTGSKAGTPKFKKIKEYIITPALKGMSGADSKTIKDYINKHCGSSSPKIQFLENLLELRDLMKTKSTYFDGYMEQSDTKGIIHSEMKHVGTPTGRLSSTKPNIQNLKGDE